MGTSGQFYLQALTYNKTVWLEITLGYKEIVGVFSYCNINGNIFLHFNLLCYVILKLVFYAILLYNIRVYYIFFQYKFILLIFTYMIDTPGLKFIFPEINNIDKLNIILSWRKKSNTNKIIFFYRIGFLFIDIILI